MRRIKKFLLDNKILLFALMLVLFVLVILLWDYSLKSCVNNVVPIYQIVGN